MRAPLTEPAGALHAAAPAASSPVVPGARSHVRRSVRPVLRTWLRIDVEGLLPRIGMVPLRRSGADAAALDVLADLLDALVALSGFDAGEGVSPGGGA